MADIFNKAMKEFEEYKKKYPEKASNIEEYGSACKPKFFSAQYKNGKLVMIEGDFSILDILEIDFVQEN